MPPREPTHQDRSSPVPAAVRAIVPETFLRAIDPALALSLLEGGRRIDVPLGGHVARKSRTPGVAIVLEGLVRVYLTSPSNERQITVRYARPGETLGLAHLYGGRMDVLAQAMSAVSLWGFPSRRLRTTADGCAPLATAIATECAELVADAVDELGLFAFGSVRQLVARHLLDLAASDAQGQRLVAKVTQQELADASGSVREVVSRVLKEMTSAGLIVRAAGGVHVLDAARLDEEVRGKSSPSGKR
jgi:CRP/FNR family transcriptional regulator, cyclic AMP receptor protein